MITGINQETVFSKIDWDDENHGVSDPEDRAYVKILLLKFIWKMVWDNKLRDKGE